MYDKTRMIGYSDEERIREENNERAERTGRYNSAVEELEASGWANMGTERGSTMFRRINADGTKTYGFLRSDVLKDVNGKILWRRS